MTQKKLLYRNKIHGIYRYRNEIICYLLIYNHIFKNIIPYLSNTPNKQGAAGKAGEKDRPLSPPPRRWPADSRNARQPRHPTTNHPQDPPPIEPAVRIMRLAVAAAARTASIDRRGIHPPIYRSSRRLGGKKDAARAQWWRSTVHAVQGNDRVAPTGYRNRLGKRLRPLAAGRGGIVMTGEINVNDQ